MHAQLLGQVVWQWLMLVVTALALVGLILLLHILVRRLAGEHDELRRNLVLMLWPIGVIYLVIGALTATEICAARRLGADIVKIDRTHLQDAIPSLSIIAINRHEAGRTARSESG